MAKTKKISKFQPTSPNPQGPFRGWLESEESIMENEMVTVKNPEAFIAAVRSQYGWAVAEQAQAIIDGESLENQNSNALKYIFNVAEYRKEHDLAELIADYLEIDYSGGQTDDEAVDSALGGTLSDEDFLNLIHSKFGWAIHAQAKAVLDGEPLEEQNPNALEYISDFAEMQGREDIATLIDSFLTGGDDAFN